MCSGKRPGGRSLPHPDTADGNEWRIMNSNVPCSSSVVRLLVLEWRWPSVSLWIMSGRSAELGRVVLTNHAGVRVEDGRPAWALLLRPLAWWLSRVCPYTHMCPIMHLSKPFTRSQRVKRPAQTPIERLREDPWTSSWCDENLFSFTVWNEMN